jgi:hypothetical protein
MGGPQRPYGYGCDNQLCHARHPIQTEQVDVRLAGAPAPRTAWIERIDEDHANPRRLPPCERKRSRENTKTEIQCSPPTRSVRRGGHH